MTEHESDREKYARRLAMFRSMGFDTSKLEDMLEHDFDRLKELGFDHIREQLEMAQRKEAEEEARIEAAKVRSEVPPPPPKPRWLERDDDRDRRLEDVLRRDHRSRGPAPERPERARHLPPDVRRVRHYKDARYDDMDYREHDDFEDYETRETASHYGPDERSKEPEFRPPPGEEELGAEGDEEEEDGDYHVDGGRRERRFIDGMRREMLDRRDREDGVPPAPRHMSRDRRMGRERRPIRDGMERRMVEGRDDGMRRSRRMMGGVRERPREPPRSRREDFIRRRKLERRIDTLDPMISFKPAKERVRPRLLDIEEEEEEGEEDEGEGGKDIIIGERGRENGREEGTVGKEEEEEEDDDKEVAMIFVGDKKHKEAKEALFGGGEEDEEVDEEEEEEDVSRTEIGPEPDDLEDEDEEGEVEEVHVVEAEPVEQIRERPRPKLRPRPRVPQGEGPIRIRSVPETDRFALKARRRPLRKIRMERGPMAAYPPHRGMGQRHVRREGMHRDDRERYGPSVGRDVRGQRERRFDQRERKGHAPGPAPRVVRKIKKKRLL